MLTTLLCLLPTTLPAIAPSTGDWPQWRGTGQDNISKETKWSPVASAEPVWLANIGAGYSSPVIASGKLVINGYLDDAETPGEGVDRVSCLDSRTGELLWSQEYPALIYNNEHAGGTLSTATIHGGTVYVASRAGELRSYSLDSGDLQWKVDLVERHQVDPSRYGFASSPYVHGEQLILNAGPTLALNRKTGATDWISEDQGASYTTIAPIQLGQTTGFVVFGSTGLSVLDAKDGTLMQTVPFRKGNRNVEGATPIVIGERVFISSGYEQGGAMVDFSGEQPEVVWRTRRMRNKMAGCTLWQDHLYGFDESMLKCMDLEGNEQWRVRGLGQGALSISNGRLLLTTSRGELVIGLASPEGFVEESRSKVIDGGVFWAAPIISDGYIFVRGSLGDLVCLNHRTGAIEASGVLASSDQEARDLPSASELVAAHLAACGLTKPETPGLRMSGKLFVKALGLDNVDALWELNRDGRWHALFDLPPAMEGSIELFFDGELGWQLNPYRGDALMEDGVLTELKRLGGPRSLLQPLPNGQEKASVSLDRFHGVPCYRVDVQIDEGTVRQVYFDLKTGRLHGRSAEDESTVLFSDWRQVEGRTLPFKRTEYNADSGEERRWVFTKIEIQAPSEDLFHIPDSILELLAASEDSDTEQSED
ncbi:MAG: outer membrane protein assembly factor BamB [Candidatus Paceibacteria bacterium]|jgi:outer membrane protein assembly factor BamB